MPSSPLLSVGMPVFNGSQWLSQAINSILTQNFTDFELIICDNASTDDTETICRQAAANDARIRYHRNVTNIGAHGNYDRVFNLSSGKYFKWATCSDYCLQDFFAKCVTVLDARPDVVLAYPRTLLLVAKPLIGEDAVEYEDNLNLEFEQPSRRFAEYLNRERYNNVMNGVMRSSALRETALNRPLPGSDISMIAELTLRGKFVEIPERLFVRRFNPETTGILMNPNTSMASAKGYPGKPTNTQRIQLHSYRFVTALRAPISFAEKMRVWRYLLRRIIWLAPQVGRKLIRLISPGH
jgi:glycosyltransferase involved in cell wall biosynthesis